MGMVEEALGEAVGQLYVAQYFNAEAKQRALTMVEQVRQAYGWGGWRLEVGG